MDFFKCPHCNRDCHSDDRVDAGVIPEDIGLEKTEGEHGGIVAKTPEIIAYQAYQCRFCENVFCNFFKSRKIHRVAPGVPWSEAVHQEKTTEIKLGEKIFSYPTSGLGFTADSVPENIQKTFEEALKCFSVGSNLGTATCLRRCVYELCDDQEASGEHYAQKIINLKIDQDTELLQHIKWLGDDFAHEGPDAFDSDMVEKAVEVTRIIIEDIYRKDELKEEAAKVLKRGRTKQVKNKKVAK